MFVMHKMNNYEIRSSIKIRNLINKFSNDHSKVRSENQNETLSIF